MHYTLTFRDVLRSYDFFVEGVVYTILLSVIAMSIAVVFGTLLAIAKSGKLAVPKRLAIIYVEVIRNTPLLIQIWFMYFGLGELGVQLRALTCGLLALALNTAAYTAEILRAGFDSVDKEIREACLSLGMRPYHVYMYAILPLGFRAVFPALGNMTIQCMLATALLSVLGINELTNQAMRLASKTFRSFEVYVVVALIYVAITAGIAASFRKAEKSLKGSLH